MDGQRFDRVARSLASGASRRTLVRALAASAVGGLLARLGVGRAAAQATCPNGFGDCDPSQFRFCCDGVCVTPDDPAHCGECGRACAPGQGCVVGQGGTFCCTPCPDGCHDLATSPSNCGACGNACPTGTICVNGACSTDCSPPCPPGLICCHVFGTIQCVDPSGPFIGGPCVGACVFDADCDDGDACTADRCGGAGAPSPTGCVHEPAADGTPCLTGDLCTENDACVGGVCRGDPIDCDDANPCTDDSCDPAVGCVHAPVPDGTACTTTDGRAGSCQAGGCVAPTGCPGGTTACGGACTDTRSDPDNCGACGNACPQGAGCEDGACGAPRDPADCAALDLQTMWQDEDDEGDRPRGTAGMTWAGQVANWTEAEADDLEFVFLRYKSPPFPVPSGDPTASAGGATAEQVDERTDDATNEVRRSYRSKLGKSVPPGKTVEVKYSVPNGWFFVGVGWTLGGESVGSTPPRGAGGMDSPPIFDYSHGFMGHILPVPVGDDGKPRSNDWHIEGRGLVGAAATGSSGKVRFTPETQGAPAKIDVTEVNYDDFKPKAPGESSSDDMAAAQGKGATSLTVIRRARERLAYWHTLNGEQVGDKGEFG